MNVPPAPSAATALPAEVAAFIQGGVSISVAGRDDRLVPSLSKAVGCRVSEGGREVTILLFADLAEAVARDITHTRRIAVVFSQPSTNRTVQIKGRDATPASAGPADLALVRRYLAIWGADLARLGWDQRYVEAVAWRDPAQLIAVRFTPEGAFHQTPGPGAGKAMDLRTPTPS
jgi:hypothetical protein